MEMVAILGLGYVGFPLVELLVKTKKYKVIGLDISGAVVSRVRRLLKSKNFMATSDFTKLLRRAGFLGTRSFVQNFRIK